jgi:hypothetical protein
MVVVMELYLVAAVAPNVAVVAAAAVLVSSTAAPF